MGDDVARPAEGRQPAAPMSSSQIARRVRILRAASELGAREGLASVQMHDVAKEADVAIATLYRYFPSKPYLFMAVLEWHIEQYLGGHENGRENLAVAAEGTDAAAEVAELLITLSVKLLDSPLLASAVALSSFTEYTSVVPARMDLVDSALGQAILRLLRAGCPRGLGDRPQQGAPAHLRLVGAVRGHAHRGALHRGGGDQHAPGRTVAAHAVAAVVAVVAA